MSSFVTGRRPTRRAVSLAALIAVLSLVAGLGGCIRRTLTITSEPDGALCWLNGRELGRTPVTVDFLHYGEYDVQLTHEGCEPLLTSGKADAPLEDTIPFDLVTEAWPKKTLIDIHWHYVLEPRKTDRAELIDRAEELRQKLLTETPPPPGMAQTQPQTQPSTQPETQPGTQPQSKPASAAAPASSPH